MKIYPKRQKSTPGWYYWGDYGEIDMGFSSGHIGKKDKFQKDKLHYHKKGVVYLLTLKGRGSLEVEGQGVIMEKDALIRIDPGEKYCHIGVLKRPFTWITVCTSKDPKDKVIDE